MPRLKLTEKAVAKIEAPDPSGRQTLHWDETLRGFAVLASGVSNSKTFIVQRDLPNGRTRRVTVGAVNTALSVEKARSRAADMLDDLRRGKDPKRRGDLTLQGALDGYLAARKDLRPASIRAYRSGVETYLSSWLDLKLRDVTADMVEARHKSIAAEISRGERYKGTTQANLAMRALRIVYNYAVERAPDLPPNPVKRLRGKWYPEERRTRVVSAKQMPQFYQAVCGLANPIARDFVLLMLFTGLRLSEAASLRWEDVNLVERVIQLPATATKSRRKLDLPMTDVVHDLLVARRALGDTKFVFPGHGANGHIADASHPLDAVAEATGIRIAAHDLRRGFITIAESCNISLLALKALVGHATGADVTSGYVQMTVERLREPAQDVANKIKELCGIVAPGART